ncbi:prepilin-type N-terminal cleavage/methylation domain-containing protein [Candidatus Falkowbacteria bacterium]|nr:prepilin-type N-terminal cleavage/methylation domain-containing protein [Candidatus Falkowbacteria bacterium]
MKKGFTIIELLVSIAIVATITALGVMTFTNYNEEKQLKNVAVELAGKIGEIRLRAFSGQKVEGAVPKYFGLQVEGDQASYSLFADFAGDCWFDASDILIEKIMLPSKVLFQAIPGQKVCYKTNEAMNFVCSTSGCDKDQQQIFYLAAESGGASKKVIVDFQNGMARVEE